MCHWNFLQAFTFYLIYEITYIFIINIYVNIYDKYADVSGVCCRNQVKRVFLYFFMHFITLPGGAANIGEA